jgi:TolB-like protein/class 3 adenylate cyclase
MTTTRRLAAILAADVAGYSRLIGTDEQGTLNRLKAIRTEIVDPSIEQYRGRIVKTTGDGLLVEFSSVVDALQCATGIQAVMAERSTGIDTEKRIEFRMGINVGDVVVEDGDIFGDGVNVAARLEALANPGEICVSARVQEDAVGKLDLCFEDMGEQSLKNIARRVRVYRVRLETVESQSTVKPVDAAPVMQLPDKPSIAVLPFANMSGDPDQEYFADGMVEEIITALSRIRWLFVIARNSSFTYKGQTVDVKQVGRELGVRYVLEGSVRKAGERVRITGQLIDALTGTHLWADRFDGSLEDVFELQEKWRSASLVSSNRHCKPPRPLVRLIARRTTLPPTTSICALTLWSGHRQGMSLRRSVCLSRRLNAIRITALLSLGPRSAITASASLAWARTRRRTAARLPSLPGGPWKWPATIRASWRMLPSRWPISARKSVR